MVRSLEPLVVRHTLRVPAPKGPAGDGGVAARRFDAALMSVGFKLSADLLEHLSGLAAGTVIDTAAHTLRTVRGMVGDHVQHNAYFIDFPDNVPDTFEFWMGLVAKTFADDVHRTRAETRLSSGVLNLLALPGYGEYQHTYTEMLAHHDELIAAAGDRVTVLHLGGDLDAEATALYLALAGSGTPLGEDGLRDLAVLAEHRADGPQPDTIPVRENRAVVNRVRLDLGADLLLDTVTDVLRLACALSGGDVTLQEPTRFANLPRRVRRALLAGLDAVVAADPAKLADVNAHREPWKRLGERLHPHEYPRWPHAADVFAVARGEKTARTFDSRVEELLAEGDVAGAVTLLENAPGRLYRALDRLLRTASTRDERDLVLTAAERVADRVSGRVVLSVREHFQNRAAETGVTRVFTNRLGRAWTTPDHRLTVPYAAVERLNALLDAETARRLPGVLPGPVLVDPAVLDVALPLSGKAAGTGLGVLPRGSAAEVEGELLRFFVHWRQTGARTDYDLSALLLDEDYGALGWLDYTALTSAEGEHSGDITDAPDGASEFINLRLGAVRGAFVVPQVNIFAGEGFEEVAESFFGYMLRDAEQKGRPFEPRTVRTKSELRGPGRVALPLVFMRGDGDDWYVKWLHLYLRGLPWGNQVSGHRLTVGRLVRAVVRRRHLTVRYLTGLLGDRVTLWDGRSLPGGPVTFVGLERPGGLPDGSRAITPENLRDLVPA
ncbi:TerD family protein [Actinomadura namibiensis]|uniref:TerD domain-containing protein n=1 Tax=Actinomadura namibiensis TaxID=182080 RepID=A0A7W3LW53_ACTNM|nr:TerD family protein [Actinomadura namibiensis]MBA8955356.1 hypothetical protein [Actinomadura namibiensis]